MRRRGRTMRIEGIDPAQVDAATRRVLDTQAEAWGSPLLNHVLYARRPTIFRGARGMWAGLAGSGLLDERLVTLVNRRVAGINGCVF